MGKKLIVLGLIVCVWVLMFQVPTEQAMRSHPVPPPVPSESIAGDLVIDLQDGSSEAELARLTALLGAEVRWVHPETRDEALAIVSVSDVARARSLLINDANVEVAEPSIEQSMFGYPNDPLYKRQWHLDAMGAPAAWARSPKGSGVIVAVLDTGISAVEDLMGEQILQGESFVNGEETVADLQGHGTHVAGTIAQSTHNGLGAAGVAPEAQLLPVKVLSSRGGGTSEGIAAGIDYAVDEGAHVINLSLGGSYSQVIHLAIQKARKQGVLVIAAAGNSGRKGVSYPGALPETIGVSALGPKGELAHYSSWGKGVDIAAPGGDTRKNGGGVLQNTVNLKGKEPRYAEFQGTSMATPHVSGAAAILLSMGLTPDEVEKTLMTSAKGGDWEPQMGNGRLDLGAALGQADTRHSLWQFGLAGLMLMLLSRLGMTGVGRVVVAGLVAGVVAGGLFFLDWLPIEQHWIVQTVSEGILYWPTRLFGRFWGMNPLWLSALVPLTIAFVMGVSRSSRVIALGVVVGVGTQLMYGSVTDLLSPSLLPSSIGTLWLGLNATICFLLALALVGMDSFEEGTRT